jgi:hypothetical protein
MMNFKSKRDFTFDVKAKHMLVPNGTKVLCQELKSSFLREATIMLSIVTNTNDALTRTLKG